MSAKLDSLKKSRLVLLSQQTTMVTRGLNEANQATFDKLENEIRDIESDISMLEKIESKLGDIRSQQEPEKIKQAAEAGIRSALPGVLSAFSHAGAETPEQRKAKLNAAYRDLLVNGHREEQRDILTSGTDGQSLIPQEFGFLTQAATFYGPVANLVSSVNAERLWKFPIADDTSANSMMSLLAEGSSSSSLEVDPLLSSVSTAGMDSLVTIVRYSKQLAADAQDFSAFLQSIAGLRVARSLEKAITLGTAKGNTQLPNSPTGGLLASVPVGVTQSAGTLSAGITLAQLNSLAASVDNAYYVNGSFMASPSVRNFLAAQVTTTGKPLYKVDPVTGNLLIQGKQLYINASMPAAGTANGIGVLFGDFSKAYVYVSNGLQIRILEQRFAELYLNAAVIYTRLAAQPLVSGAVKALKLAAS